VSDIFTQAKRSDVMSRIRSRGNRATELALVRVFRAHHITGWRRQRMIRGNVQRPTSHVERSKLSVGRWKFSFRVRPDFVFPKLRLAVFVDGCFWHGCPQHETKPRNNAAFWRKKFATNKARDRLVTRTLRKNGWRVLRLWEHELARKREARLVRRIQAALTHGNRTPHP
jgi:DNA mismatch endonuclease (patch repair protein)